RIKAVGRLPGRASKIIDATGLLVTPGFIDIHTHCDLTFKRSGWKRYLSYFMPSWKGDYNYLYQGVTTVVTGNCGYGYTDTDQWLGMVEDLSFGTNVYHLAPHGMIRQELFGEPSAHGTFPRAVGPVQGARGPAHRRQSRKTGPPRCNPPPGLRPSRTKAEKSFQTPPWPRPTPSSGPPVSRP
ncbi:MAG: amidohydrolase family protein, partial [Deltaproteobacteria bacterium]|nr:amidohydrolase family protein [Deltaproteobacteria bacterium]